MPKITPVGRIGSRNIYFGPDGRTAMRYPEAKAAHAKMAKLRADLSAEIAHSKATGFGDHAKIARLDHAIAQMEGRA